jgi:hypothetical protein
MPRISTIHCSAPWDQSNVPRKPLRTPGQSLLPMPQLPRPSHDPRGTAFGFMPHLAARLLLGRATRLQ